MGYSYGVREYYVCTSNVAAGRLSVTKDKLMQGLSTS